MNIIICDDDKTTSSRYAKRLKNIATSLKIDLSVITFYSGETLLLNQEDWLIQTSVIFMDIDLVTMDGIQLVKQIRKLGYKGEVIYLTNSRTHVFDVFETQPFDYLIKDEHSADKLRHIFLKVYQKIHQLDDQYIHIQTAKKNIRLFLDDISYFEIKKRVVSAYFLVPDLEDVNFYLTMHELEAKLPTNQFVRVHRAFIVNMNTIQSIASESVILRNQVKVPLSRKYKPAFSKTYGYFLERVSFEL